MKTCLHCGETFAREFDGALGSIVNYGTTNPFVSNYQDDKVCCSVYQDERIVSYLMFGGKCPKCDKATIILRTYKYNTVSAALSHLSEEDLLQEISLYPFHNERPVSTEVPVPIADDYKEATRISGISRKGSATLARRCLQATLRHSFPEMGKKPNLKQEIDWVNDNTNLDDTIKDVLHTLRDAGNFGAHAAEDGLTEIYELSQEDLEACFLLLDNLFDILYVEPARKKSKLEKLKERISSSKK